MSSDLVLTHFGITNILSTRLKAANTKFVIEPTIRFKGKVGEQATMFFTDPENNALEFKAFQDISQLFAT